MEKDTRCASAELDCEREGRWSGRLPFQCGHSNAASPSSPHTSEKSGAARFFCFRLHGFTLLQRI